MGRGPTAKQAAAICAVSVPLNGMKDDAQADRPFRPNFPQFAAATSGSREKLYLVGDDGQSIVARCEAAKPGLYAEGERLPRGLQSCGCERGAGSTILQQRCCPYARSLKELPTGPRSGPARCMQVLTKSLICTVRLIRPRVLNDVI